METTKNELPKNVRDFFYHLSDYLDTKFLYFGSVQRSDYVPGKSDIDVDVFTENEYSLMNKMQHYLHVSRHEFRKVAWILDDVPVYGYKLKYENKKEDIYFEFSIYNDKFKELISNEHKSKFVLPFYITIILRVLKFFYYEIPLLNKNTFINIKRFTLNTAIGRDSDSKFLVLDSV
jgi:predicted nucleotidyltransferase